MGGILAPIAALSLLAIDTGPNRRHWNAISRDYQAAHDPVIGASPRLWGMFAVPDDAIGALGDLSGRAVLEYGCGGGQWAGALADEGVSVVGLDLSDQQLAAASDTMRSPYPLVQAAGEAAPFADASFDVVFCDHGVMSWGDPARTVPEASRLLRSGGRLVFNASSPWFEVSYDEDVDRVGGQLRRPYFGLGRMADEEAASYCLPYGDWIRLFRRHRLAVEDLIEIRPPSGATSTYATFDPPDWPQRWPAECLWVARKE